MLEIKLRLWLKSLRSNQGLVEYKRMPNWLVEFRRAWQGTISPSVWSVYGFVGVSVFLATLARWGLSLIRPDVVPYTIYYPAVLFAALFGGFRAGAVAALLGGVVGFWMHFGYESPAAVQALNVTIYVAVSAIVVAGAAHYRSVAAHYREMSARLAQEEQYRKLVIDELQHRLKNKLATIHAIVHQVLRDQPEIWKTTDGRIRALAETDDLIARADGHGCGLRDMLDAELGPYGSSRISLNGDRLFLPAKLAVSMALILHELATNAAKYGAFSVPQGLLQVSWIVTGDRLRIVWDETGGPSARKPETAGFGTRLLASTLKAFDGATDIEYLPTGIHCMIECRLPAR